MNFIRTFFSPAATPRRSEPVPHEATNSTSPKVIVSPKTDHAATQLEKRNVTPQSASRLKRKNQLESSPIDNDGESENESDFGGEAPVERIKRVKQHVSPRVAALKHAEGDASSPSQRQRVPVLSSPSLNNNKSPAKLFSLFSSPKVEITSNIQQAPLSLPMVSTPSTSATTTGTKPLRSVSTPPLTGPRSKKLLWASPMTSTTASSSLALPPTALLTSSPSQQQAKTITSGVTGLFPTPPPSSTRRRARPRTRQPSFLGLEDEAEVSPRAALSFAKTFLEASDVEASVDKPSAKANEDAGPLLGEEEFPSPSKTSSAKANESAGPLVGEEEFPSMPTVRRLSFEPPLLDKQSHGQESKPFTKFPWGKEHPLLKRVRIQLNPLRIEDGKEFFGLDLNRARLAQVLRDAYMKKEPSSVLLVGPEGTGKTHCLKGAMRDLANEKLMYKVIELDGKSLVTDGLAAKEITRQLCLELHQGVKESLESLMDDEAAMDDGNDDDDEDEVQYRPVAAVAGTTHHGTFSDHLRFLVQVLKESKHSDRLLFKLKNFEDFCRRPKQTLLYALLDMAHAVDCKFVVVAVSEGIDCIANLDKRVRSRFDNIQLVFPKQAYTLEGMLDLVRSRLLLQSSNPTPQLESWNRMVDDCLKRFEPKLNVLVMAAGKTVGFVLKHIVNQALARLEYVVFQDDPRFERCATIMFGSNGGFTLDLAGTLSLCMCDAQTSHVRGMSREELVLLLAAVYLERVRKMDVYSFESLFEASHKIRRGSPETSEPFQIRAVGKHVALLSYDSLVRNRFLKPFGQNRKNVPKEYRPMQLAFNDVDAGLLTYVKSHPDRFHLSLIYWAKHLLTL